MKTTFPTSRPFSLSLVLLLAAAGGCVMVPDANEPPPATKAEVQYLRDEMRRMNDRLQASEAQYGDIQRNLYSAEANRPAAATPADIAVLREQIEALQRQVRELDAARAADKRAIYDDISRKVAEIVKKSAPAATSTRTSSRQTGIEHVVQPGDTLSTIAQAYNKKTDELIKANGLKNANTIFVGQKLFVPD
ncbi:MAG: LysM peptidoglycan-binding domain-containing protein [Kiritimatiellae bacterium]|nr:LysM peptidoglycan-binding domain-containing protein [Kiritimatiellia bacterium]